MHVAGALRLRIGVAAEGHSESRLCIRHAALCFGSSPVRLLTSGHHGKTGGALLGWCGALTGQSRSEDKTIVLRPFVHAPTLLCPESAFLRLRTSCASPLLALSQPSLFEKHEPPGAAVTLCPRLTLPLRMLSFSVCSCDLCRLTQRGCEFRRGRAGQQEVGGSQLLRTAQPGEGVRQEDGRRPHAIPIRAGQAKPVPPDSAGTVAHKEAGNGRV